MNEQQTTKKRSPRTIPNNAVMYTNYTGDETCTVVLILRKKVIGVYLYRIDAKEYFSLGKSEDFFGTYYKLVYSRHSSFQDFATLTFNDKIAYPPMDTTHVQSFLIAMLSAYIDAMTPAKQQELPGITPETTEQSE